jgi:PAS domain S-box-containing protein
MLAFREFANFIALNMANLATTYARLLAESNKDYATFSLDSRTASARRLLKAVIDSYESQTSAPLVLLFAGSEPKSSGRWAENTVAPQPLIEIECLGQTLTPVVTNLEAGKFLWQLLAETRAALLSDQKGLSLPVTAAGKATDDTESPVSLKPATTEQWVENLIKERDLLRAVIDSLPDHIYVKDTAGRFMLGNRATALSLGAATPDEIVGKTDFDFSPPELAEQYYADEQAIFQSAEPLIYKEEPVQDHVTGERRWVATTKVLLRDKEEQLVGLVGINHDMTERKRAQEASQANEARYRSLFEDSPISLWEEDFSAVKTYIDDLKRAGVTDFRTYFKEHPEAVGECAMKVKIVDINRRTLELYEANTKTEFFEGLGRVFGEESFAPFMEELIAISEGRTRLDIEAVNYTLTGKRKYLNLTWFVAPGYQETFNQVLISIIDITEQEQIEMALREGEARYRSLFEDSPISLWEEDFSAVKTHLDSLKQAGVADFRAYFKEHPEVVGSYAAKVKIVGVNRATLELFHAKSLEEFFGGLNQIFGPETFGVFQEELATLAEGKSRFESEGVNYTLTGERKDIVLRAFITPGHEENWSQVLITMNDITELKRLEQQIRESLERRTRQVETSIAVAQEIALAPALSALFDQVVNLVQAQFGYYHVHVYTLVGDYLVFQEGTGEAGRRMKETGHKIAFTAEQSLVAVAARTGEPALVSDVSQAAGWLPDSLLSETKAELALPIKLGNTVLGVLDIQNNTIGSLSEEDQLLLMGLCGQIAVTFNGRQIEDERERLLAEVERRAHREQTIREITEKMRAATSLEDLVKTTAEELGQRFAAEYTLVNLGIESSPERRSQPKNGHSHG